MTDNQFPVDFDAALVSPTAYFKQPHDVLEHPGLSRTFKLKVLHQWEQDARLLADAESEGMSGGEESMLARVRQALRALDPQETGLGDAPLDEPQTSIGATVKSIAEGLGEAASRVHHAATQTREGVAEVRGAIRGQPVTAAVLIFAFGYMFGRLTSLFPSGREQ